MTPAKETAAGTNSNTIDMGNVETPAPQKKGDDRARAGAPSTFRFNRSKKHFPSVVRQDEPERTYRSRRGRNPNVTKNESSGVAQNIVDVVDRTTMVRPQPSSPTTLELEDKAIDRV